MTAETESEAEARAWEEVVRAWDDEARHRAYLDGQASLEALAVAGTRYRDVLAERPADPVALRFREEVIRPAALVVVGVVLALAFAAFLRVIAEWRAL